MLPTFKSWIIHRIIEYFTLGLLSSLRDIYHSTTAYFFWPACILQLEVDGKPVGATAGSRMPLSENWGTNGNKPLPILWCRFIICLLFVRFKNDTCCFKAVALLQQRETETNSLVCIIILYILIRSHLTTPFIRLHLAAFRRLSPWWRRSSVFFLAMVVDYATTITVSTVLLR